MDNPQQEKRKQKVSFGKMVVINAYWVGLSFMWNALHPLILPAILIKLVPEAQKNTYLGLLTFVGLILAMIIQPISGTISDSWRSGWGRRRPLILIGSIFDLAFLAILGWVGGLAGVFIGYLGLQLSSNIAHGPLQGLLPDLVPEKQVGFASGLKTFLDMSGLIVASLVAGNLLGPQNEHLSLVMLVVIAGIVLFGGITLIGSRERSSLDLRPSSRSNLLRDFLKIDLKANRSFFWMIAQRFLFLIGIFGVQAFAQYHIRDVLQVPNAVKATGDLMATLAVGLVLCALAGGWLTDKFGAKIMTIIAGVLTATGCLLILLVKNIGMLTLFGGIVGAGMGIFLTANWALATRLAPPAESGKFLGLTNIATAGSSALARLEGPAIDLLNAAAPGRFNGYRAIFIFAAICTLLSLLLLKFIDLPENKSSDPAR